MDCGAYESTPSVQIAYLTKMIDSISCECIAVIFSLAMRIMSYDENSPDVTLIVRWKSVCLEMWKMRLVAHKLRLFDGKFPTKLPARMPLNLTAAAVWLGLALLFRLRDVYPCFIFFILFFFCHAPLGPGTALVLARPTSWFTFGKTFSLCQSRLHFIVLPASLDLALRHSLVSNAVALGFGLTASWKLQLSIAFNSPCSCSWRFDLSTHTQSVKEKRDGKTEFTVN